MKNSGQTNTEDFIVYITSLRCHNSKLISTLAQNSADIYGLWDLMEGYNRDKKSKRNKKSTTDQTQKGVSELKKYSAKGFRLLMNCIRAYMQDKISDLSHYKFNDMSEFNKLITKIEQKANKIDAVELPPSENNNYNNLFDVDQYIEY